MKLNLYRVRHCCSCSEENVGEDTRGERKGQRAGRLSPRCSDGPPFLPFPFSYLPSVEAVGYIHFLWSTILQIVVSVALLFNVLGASAFAGLGFMVIRCVAGPTRLSLRCFHA